MYYPCSENKGADQLICAFVFAYADCWFSHEAAQLLMKCLIVSHILFSCWYKQTYTCTCNYLS